ncbi:MAG: HAD family hydrolase [Candidatus Promineifilaceae bacterium]
MLSPAKENRRALILDFDGVVVDTEWLHFESWNATFEEQYGRRVGGSSHQLVGMNLHQIFDVWRKAEGHEPLEFDEAEEMRLLVRKTALFFEIGKGRLQLMDGVLDLVQAAQDAGWYIGIASRSARIRLLRTLALTDAPAVFDVIMAYEDSVNDADRKEHARAAAVFGISPENAVVIEDSGSGVRTALDCGIGRVIGITTSLGRAALFAAGAHEVVDNLAEVRL